MDINRPLIVGVMGGGNADAETIDNARQLGALIAQNGWVLLNGGRRAGIMDAAAQGAAEAGGLTIGVLPDDDTSATSDYIQIPILTGMGSARNTINVLSSDVVVACPGGAGTLSEIALALKHHRPVITMGFQLPDLPGINLDRSLLYAAETPAEVITTIKSIIPS